MQLASVRMWIWFSDSIPALVGFLQTLQSVFVSPELSSERDYVITHSVCSTVQCMYVVCMWYFAKLITVSTYIDVFPWDLDTIILGKSHTCDPNRCGVKGHLGVNDLWFKFFKKRSLYPHTSMYFHGTWTQWSLGRITHVTSTDFGSKVI